MEEQAKQVAKLMGLLSNENRLLILCALSKGPMTVGKLSEYLPSITLSALSQHLNLLRLSGLLEKEKQGLHVLYSISDPRVKGLLDYLREHFCS